MSLRDAALRASVVVANWNGAAVLERCLAQIAAQTAPPLECIVVDDGSMDGSAELAAAAAGPVTVVRHAVNRGIAASRNSGIRRARGEVVAFIDNDGYAHRDWLAAALGALAADPALGAVASLVFFADRPIVLNGAGGTVNRRGYARDHCHGTPLAVATLPTAVLYPMGCGMVVRRAALDAIGALDEQLSNYYDDVEIGIRLWARGWRVAVCPDAWVDHRGGGADLARAAAQRRLLLGERHRIRTVLKYFPLRHLPAWLAHEARLVAHLGHRDRRTLPFAAWAWNLRHLGSALRIRRQFPDAARRIWPLVDDAWRLPAPVWGENRALRPSPDSADAVLRLDGSADCGRLNFGWHPAARDGSVSFRATARVASAFIRITRPVTTCTLLWRGPKAVDTVEVSARAADGGPPCWRRTLVPPPTAWERRTIACALPSGTYELRIAALPICGAGSAMRGIDLAAIAFRTE